MFVFEFTHTHTSLQGGPPVTGLGHQQRRTLPPPTPVSAAHQCDEAMKRACSLSVPTSHVLSLLKDLKPHSARPAGLARI